jgi:hypothetical protein
MGDEVTYKGRKMLVEDAGFARYVGDNDLEWCRASEGRLHYLLKDNEPTSMYHGSVSWVAAELVPDLTDKEFFEQDARSAHLQELGYNMVAWSDGLVDLPDNSKIPDVVTLLMAIQYDKEKDYGSSWKGKGEYRGIMANIDRKYDRLDKMTDTELEDATRTLAFIEKGLLDGTVLAEAVGDSKIDAVADLANYCLLYMTYVREKFPLCFNIWVERNVPLYLRSRIPFLQK